MSIYRFTIILEVEKQVTQLLRWQFRNGGIIYGFNVIRIRPFNLFGIHTLFIGN
jgi:hypothetical protein